MADEYSDSLDGLANVCWEWHGKRSRDGYGMQYGKGNVTLAAHRVAYETLRGPIPKGLVIDHICRNASCVNPYHMDVVTQRENVMRSDGITAQNARKTHCKNGHPFEGGNLYIRPDGDRDCRICRLEHVRRYRARGGLF